MQGAWEKDGSPYSILHPVRRFPKVCQSVYFVGMAPAWDLLFQCFSTEQEVSVTRQLSLSLNLSDRIGADFVWWSWCCIQRPSFALVVKALWESDVSAWSSLLGKSFFLSFSFFFLSFFFFGKSFLKHSFSSVQFSRSVASFSLWLH